MERNVTTLPACSCPGGHRSRGVITLFTSIMLLLLLTALVAYTSQISINAQRSSANEVRYKQAFHAAEAGLEQTREYFIANQILLNADDDDLLTDGTGGWLSASERHWLKCSEHAADFDSNTDPAELAHPCRGEPDMTRRAGSYFYYWDDPDDAEDDPYEIKLDTNAILDDTQQVSVRALLCLLVVNFDSTTPVSGCDSSGVGASSSHFMITVLARGESDCSAGTCLGEALVTVPLANTTLFGGDPPDVPLTTSTTFPPTGNAEVAANPNAAGLGVPLSVWVNENPSCSDTLALATSGSWATCELEEWYGQDSIPENLLCPTTNCSCSQREAISYTQAGEAVIGLDMWVDDAFPCDLIDYFFGIPKSLYGLMRSNAKLLSDCDSLGPDSYGVYWISGPECTIQNATIGSPLAPVVLLSAASTTWLNGNASLFGLLFVSNVENPDAILKGAGNNRFYGAVIVDAEVGNFAGTYQIVYNQAILTRAASYGGLKRMNGGWTDSPLYWH
jgi:hypothetical protein